MEKGKLLAPERTEGKFGAQKGKRENGGNPFCDPISLGNQTARTHARTDSTTRNDCPVGLTPQPPLF